MPDARQDALRRLSTRASDPDAAADPLSFSSRKQLRQDLELLLDGPPPLQTLQDLYNAPHGQALRSGFPNPGNVWLKTGGGWQRTGLAGLYTAERVAQDLPLQPLNERPR